MLQQNNRHKHTHTYNHTLNANDPNDRVQHKRAVHADRATSLLGFGLGFE